MRRIFLMIVVVSLIIIGFSWFLDNNTVVNNGDGLVWQDNNDAINVKKNWEDANIYCENLTLDGENDWRLPSIKELQTIVAIKQNDPAILTSFKYVVSSYYWSSSENVSDSYSAWGVFFDSGMTASNYKSNENHARCVRGRL